MIVLNSALLSSIRFCQGKKRYIEYNVKKIYYEYIEMCHDLRFISTAILDLSPLWETLKLSGKVHASGAEGPRIETQQDHI